MAELLGSPGQPPTAVFCQSDEMAFGALQTLRREGLRCPESISVIGFDDHELAAAFELTTIGQPIAEQGAAAARWLTADLDRAPDERTVTVDVLHPVRLVLRGSTAALDGSSAAIESVR
jgi:DNA-binding LacI/PurR family transcriptional regulator